MKKYLSLGLLTIALIIFAGCGTTTKETIKTETPIQTNECVEICEHANNVCDEWMESNDCREACANWDSAKKECVKNAKNCDDLEQGCFNATSIINEVSNNCDAPCKNYVKQCISQVPNATDFLRQDAYGSCTEECADWNEQKIDCIAAAIDCPSMTNVCGL